STNAQPAPDVGSLSSKPSATFSSAVLAGTTGNSSGSPSATTIMNGTGTGTWPGVTFHQLLNGRKLSKLQHNYADAVDEALQAKDQQALLVAQYRIAVLAAQLTPKEKREILFAFSAQQSSQLQYFVLSLNKSQEYVMEVAY